MNIVRCEVDAHSSRSNTKLDWWDVHHSAPRLLRCKDAVYKFQFVLYDRSCCFFRPLEPLLFLIVSDCPFRCVLFQWQLFSFVAPFLPTFAKKKGADASDVGFIFAAFPLGALAGNLIAHRLCRLFPPRGVTVFGTVLVMASCVGFSFVGELSSDWFVLVCIILRVSQGVGAGTTHSAGFLVLVGVLPSNMSEALNVMTGFTGLGLMIGPLLGGVLYEFTTFSISFYTMAGLTVLVFLLQVCALPTTPPTRVRLAMRNRSSSSSPLRQGTHRPRRRSGRVVKPSPTPAEPLLAQDELSSRDIRASEADHARRDTQAAGDNPPDVEEATAPAGGRPPAGARGARKARVSLNSASLDAARDVSASGGRSDSGPTARSTSASSDVAADAVAASSHWPQFVSGTHMLSLTTGTAEVSHSDRILVSSWTVLRRPWPALQFTCMLCAFGSIGFLGPTLAPHLDGYGVSVYLIGLLFALSSVAYALAASVCYALQKVVARAALIAAGMTLLMVGFLLIGPAVGSIPVSVSTQLTGLVCIGAGAGMIVVPAGPAMLQHRSLQRLGSGGSEAVSKLVAVSASMGEAAGPLTSSILLAATAFTRSCLAVVVVLLIVLAVLVMGVFSCDGGGCASGQQMDREAWSFGNMGIASVRPLSAATGTSATTLAANKRFGFGSGRPSQPILSTRSGAAAGDSSAYATLAEDGGEDEDDGQPNVVVL